MKKSDIQNMLQNAKELQRDIAIKYSLEEFDTGIFFYHKKDLVVLKFALAFMLENEREIINTFVQGETQ